MLCKENRIRKDREFSFVYRKGKKVANEDFVLYFYPKSYCFKVGFSINKKYGKSCERNKIKRRLSEIIYLELEVLKPYLAVIVVLKGAKEKDYRRLKMSLDSLLSKVGILNGVTGD
ncbi:MAG: ribonuclease P protein component [Abditibacteriota bacterium]|nr:ribonuclease P protein component [Abditibacteriota bacterium]